MSKEEEIFMRFNHEGKEYILYLSDYKRLEVFRASRSLGNNNVYRVELIKWVEEKK